MRSFRADLFGSWQHAKAEKFTAFLLLEFWAGLKGMHVLGTGGILNVQWHKTLQENLVWDDELGLYRNKDFNEKRLRQKLFIQLGRELLPDFAAEQFLDVHTPVRPAFVLSGTIRLVWKKHGKKHFQNIWVALPGFGSCSDLHKATAPFGELQVSGVPRLNLSPKNFIEIIGEVDHRALLCPIFEVQDQDSPEYGQTVEEFQGHVHYFDLQGSISLLPGFADLQILKGTPALQPAQMGRAFTTFSGSPSYDSLKDLAKIHGPFNQVANNFEFTPSVPLQDLLAEITGLKPRTRKLLSLYGQCLQRFGCEADILESVEKAEADKFLPFLGEALERMRLGKFVTAITDNDLPMVFTPEERERIQHGLGSGSVKKQQPKSAQGVLLEGTLFGTTEQPVVNLEELQGTEEGSSKNLSGAIVEHMEEKTDVRTSPEDGDFVFASSPEDFLDKSAIGGTEQPAKPQSGQNPSQVLLPIPPVEDLPWSLDQIQSNIVFNPASPILVSSPAGTGKGRMLFARILHLLDEGISPHRIVAITATRRAGAVLDSLLEQSLTPGSPLPRTDTIYALALELWHKTHGDVPVLLSDKNARIVFSEVNTGRDQQTISKAFSDITESRQRMAAIAAEYEDLAARYSQHKNAWNLADYTDLLEFWKEQIDAGIYKTPWEHILVDGVEDISPLEMYIIKALLSASGEGFFGLGNLSAPRLHPSFCFESPKEALQNLWPGLQTFSLHVNYRSTPEILKVSELFAGENNSGEQVVSAVPSGRRPQVFSAPDPFSEAQWMAEQINDLLAEGFPANEIGVLVRIPSLLPDMATLLLQAGIPAQVAGQDAFWQDPRIDLILNMAGRVYGIDLGELGNEMHIECPDKVIAKGPLAIAAYLSTVPPFTVDFWSSRAFRDLCKAHRTHRTWAGLLTWVGLNNEREFTKSKVFKVQVALGSLAKGLSFQAVFLPCMEDGLMPFVGEDMLCGRSNKTPDLANEQAWLRACMGMAEKRLYLSSSRKRVLFGKEYRLPASRFLEQIPKNYAVRTRLVAHETRQEAQLSLF